MRKVSLRKVRGTAATSKRPRVFESQGPRSKAFLTPADQEYEELMECSYSGFAMETSQELSSEFHSKFRRAFQALDDAGLFQYDVVAAGGKTLSKTFVRRTLVGDPGITYKYLGLRIFAHPWSEDDPGDDAEGSTEAMRRAAQTVGELNRVLIQRTREKLSAVVPPATVTGPCDFNLTLINQMDPRELAPSLRDEPNYGMGKTSVSWHADSGLKDFSSIAVYHQTEVGKNKGHDNWRVALRVAEDDVTPAVVVPTSNGDLYYLLDDFNHHHHHAVLSGDCLRYSSTHRVAKEDGHTWAYISSRCKKIIGALKTSPWKSVQVLQDELEFEWLQQWHIQGQLHADIHPWWQSRIAALLAWWKTCEAHTQAQIERLVVASDPSRAPAQHEHQVPASHDSTAGNTGKKGKKGKKRSAPQVPQGETSREAPCLEDVKAFTTMVQERVTRREYWDSRRRDRVFKSLPSQARPMPFPPEASPAAKGSPHPGTTASAQDQAAKLLQARDLLAQATGPRAADARDVQGTDKPDTKKPHGSNWAALKAKLRATDSSEGPQSSESATTMASPDKGKKRKKSDDSPGKKKRRQEQQHPASNSGGKQQMAPPAPGARGKKPKKHKKKSIGGHS